VGSSYVHGAEFLENSLDTNSRQLDPIHTLAPYSFPPKILYAFSPFRGKNPAHLPPKSL
jgi:hypothetical protein